MQGRNFSSAVNIAGRASKMKKSWKNMKECIQWEMKGNMFHLKCLWIINRAASNWFMSSSN